MAGNPNNAEDALLAMTAHMNDAYLVTEDKGALKRAARAGIAALTPDTFMRRLRDASS